MIYTHSVVSVKAADRKEWCQVIKHVIDTTGIEPMDLMMMMMMMMMMIDCHVFMGKGVQ